MDSSNPSEVTYRRWEQAASDQEMPDEPRPAAITAEPKESVPVSTDDPDDDLPVSSDLHDVDAALVGSPNYGEIGPSRRVRSDLEIEPVSGYRASLPELSGLERASAAGEAQVLDAWYAEFGHPGIAALLRRPEIARAIAEATVDVDDRAQIAEAEDYPWRCICALNITAADGSRWTGTGWLSSSRTVITAGHCVYMHSRGGWVTQVEVVPGCHGDHRPYGSGIAASFRSVKGWMRKQKRTYDYGAILLPVDRAFGKLLGYFGFANLSDLDLRDLKVNLAGYPGDKPRGTQWYHARRLEAISSRALDYRVDTAGGQSGAPVWRLKNGERHAIGIHTNGDVSGNSAIRINDPVFHNINTWTKEGS